MISGSADKTIRVWRTATGVCIWTLKGHDNKVTLVACSNDSALVASSSNDRTVRVWCIATGECIQTVHVGFTLRRMSFQAGRSYLMTDHGIFAIGNVRECSPARSSTNNTLARDSFFSISADNCWVVWNGNRLLWLAKDYRPFALAVSGTLIVMGCASGAVILLGFSPEALSEDFAGY